MIFGHHCTQEIAEINSPENDVPLAFFWPPCTCLRAIAGCRLLMKTVGVLGGCGCGGKVIVLDVEAVSSRGAVDRRDVDAGWAEPVRGVDAARWPNSNPPGGVA